MPFVHPLLRVGSDAMEQRDRLLSGLRQTSTYRYQQMECLERYFDNRQHEGKPNWWDTSQNVPLQERAPCVCSHLPTAIVNEVVDFTLGERKFPSVSFASHDQPRVVAGVDLALSEDEAKQLTALWHEISKQLKFRKQWRKAMRRGCSIRTAACVYALRRGRLCMELLDAKYCDPTFLDEHSDELKSVDVQWLECVQEPTPTGHLEDVWYYRRRLIDQYRDVMYVPIQVKYATNPNDLQWQEDPAQTVDHGLGICPVQWMPNLPDGDRSQEHDGRSLYENILSEIDEIDCALSIRQTGVVAQGTAQPYETGVQPGQGPNATGRQPITRQFGDTTIVVGANPNTGSGGGARKRSPLEVWTYSGEANKTKIGFLEVTGAAAKMVTEHIDDLRAHLLRAVRVVLVDTSEIKGGADMSAKLLALMHAPLLALVDDERDCWGEQHMKNAINLVFRLLEAAVAMGATVLLPGLEAALPILQRQVVTYNETLPTGEAFPVELWMPLDVQLGWGPHFAPTPKDIESDIKAAKDARAHGDGEGAEPLVTQRTAMGHISRHFGNVDVDDEMDALETEAEEKKAEDEERNQREQANLHNLLRAQNLEDAPSEEDDEDGDSRAQTTPPNAPAQSP